MASLVLGVAGTALGSSLFGGGLSFLGVTLTGAQIGGAIGAAIGTQIDAALMPAVKRSGPRLGDITLQSSTEGAPVARVYGRMRLAGQLLWATRFKETTTTTTVGGKGAAPAVKQTDYAYSISFAVGLCAGPVARIARVWADGHPLDLSAVTMRLLPGDETQLPDPLIEEIEGAGNTPAYRGVAVAVFEDLSLAAYGNRIPQLQFEVIRPVASDAPDALENRLKGVALIPGAGEFVLSPDVVTRDNLAGVTAPENAHTATGADVTASLDDLQALAPQLGAISLVVGWFGDDLRAGACRIRPGAETLAKATYPETWSVDGVARADAHLVSAIDGRPAYGGTPSDAGVVAAVAALKARGLRVLFNPFLFLDVPSDNTLPNPYSDNAAAIGQGAYPWRGRITVSPAPGFVGSVDRTAAAATQIAAFFGNATAADFAVDGTSVRWIGGDDWGYRRFILHCALLCAAAGGVDAFLIGSELRALTRARSDDAAYPAVAALKALAADVRTILGSGTKIGYGADWSEYGAHQTGDAPGAVRFPLDALWSDDAIAFVGIDNYLPLADWRDGTAHRDAQEFSSLCDPAYLASNIRGGEGYDWFYADAAARAMQERTAIGDSLGKPWVWRAKDLWGWWSNPHYERPLGVEDAMPTAWVARSKPIWFTELGCPAADKAANQPNVFYDPKSAESALPYWSNGARDDLMQRRFLEAHLAFWSDAANNPAMVDAANLYAWCWDARPYPFFPARADVWGDAANYAIGHWLNGRLGAVRLADLVAALCAEAGFADIDVSGLDGLVTGYAVTDTMSVREALGPLMTACFFDGVESEGVIRFVMRGRPDPVACSEDDLVLADEGVACRFDRAQETDLPLASRIAYIDAAEYRQAMVESRRLVALSDRVATSSLPMVLDQSQDSGIGDRLLQDAWTMRESAHLSLPPSLLALDPCDEIMLDMGGRSRRLRIVGIDDAGARTVEGVATDPAIYEPLTGAARSTATVAALRQPGRALVVFLDLPQLREGQDPAPPLAAAFADPWPGAVQILKSPTGAGYTLDTTLTRPARIGTTSEDFYSGPLWRWDKVNSLCLALDASLASASDAAVFAGANALAVQNADGGWEIVQFAEAELTAPGHWRLSRLLRGRRGTEAAMRHPLAAGARVVVLDEALRPLALDQATARRACAYLWGPAGKPLSDPSYQGATLSFGAAGLMPFAPAHVRHAWSENGDLVISWRRRDRAPSAENLVQAATPLSEAVESYDLEIMAGGAVVRSFSAIAQHSQIYTAAEQAADFPAGLPDPLVVNVYQRSSVLGRGRQKTESLYVR
ncbi:MAG: glycoside hydrolase/phage tail family protein [Alphaproteobacteria bacterium]|nr:glycoside hydrolase/phage tail family protein [Alphaproteobacteria bacterium]